MKLLEKSQVFLKSLPSWALIGEIFPYTSQLWLSLLEREWMSLKVRLLHNLATSPFSGTMDRTSASVYLALVSSMGLQDSPTPTGKQGPTGPMPIHSNNENAREERRPPEALSVL